MHLQPFAFAINLLTNDGGIAAILNLAKSRGRASTNQTFFAGEIKGAMSPHTHARANENKLEKVGPSFSSSVGDFGRLFLSV